MKTIGTNPHPQYDKPLPPQNPPIRGVKEEFEALFYLRKLEEKIFNSLLRLQSAYGDNFNPYKEAKVKKDWEAIQQVIYIVNKGDYL